MTYHVISKLRGNEKNRHMNNFGVALAVLGFVYYSVFFNSKARRMFLSPTTNKWMVHQWLYWSANSAYLLYHWFFNWRYVKSTFRLPVLKKGAEFHSDMLDQIILQR